jgi:ATP-dependent Zn protease
VNAPCNTILSRFVEQIEIGLLDESARQRLLEVFLRGVSCNGSLQDLAARLAALTPNLSGRDIQQVVNKAVLSAVKRCGKSGNAFRLEESDFALLAMMDDERIPSDIHGPWMSHPLA